MPTTADSAVLAKTKVIDQALNEISSRLRLTFYVHSEVNAVRGFVTCNMRNLKEAEVLRDFVITFIHPDACVEVRDSKIKVLILVDEDNA